MQRILVATDFSTRSDRALRRSVLLARQHQARIVLLHVVDDDQPPRMVAAERRETQALLDETARTMAEIEGVACETAIGLGEPFEGILGAAAEAVSDLVVMGPHRRQILRDVFLGTTVERTIRLSRLPVLMANSFPSGPYRRVLLATDLSENSGHALSTAGALGLLNQVDLVVMHGFEDLAGQAMLRNAMSIAQVESHHAAEAIRARRELSAFLDRTGARPARPVVKLVEARAAPVILDCAREERADLVIVGTHGRAGFEKLLLGSVTEQLLRESEIDVLAVPPADRAR